MINKSALVKVIGIGLVTAAVLQVIGGQLTAAAGFADDTTSANSPYPDMLLALAFISILVDLGFGALYGFLDQRDSVTTSAGRFALGGGIAGAVIGFIVVVVSTIVNWQANLQAMEQLQAVTPTINEQSMILRAAGDIIVSVLLTAALAAAGGGIYGSIVGSRTVQHPPTV